MARNQDIQQILFPVELVPIFYHPPARSLPPQTSLFDELDREDQYERVSRYQAVMRTDTGEVFSVVSSDYRLVSNEEALTLGKFCLQQAFNTLNTADMEVFNIITPSTKSFCHIDLIHKGYEVNIWNREIWLPYLRVTNSYNRRYPLQLSLGYCRAVCENGCIFEKFDVKTRFFHTHQQIAPQGVKIDLSRMVNLESSFVNYMNVLKDFPISREDALPLTIKSLSLRFDTSANDDATRDREIKRWQNCKSMITSRVEKYFNELGDNAYAQFSVITDLASRPVFILNQSVMIDSYQKRAGQWLASFVHEIQKTGFSLTDYLQDEQYQWIRNN